MCSGFLNWGVKKKECNKFFIAKSIGFRSVAIQDYFFVIMKTKDLYLWRIVCETTGGTFEREICPVTKICSSIICCVLQSSPFCALFTLILFFDHKNVLGVKECNWLSKLIRMKSGFGFKLRLVKERVVQFWRQNWETSPLPNQMPSYDM